MASIALLSLVICACPIVVGMMLMRLYLNRSLDVSKVGRSLLANIVDSGALLERVVGMYAVGRH